MPAPVAKLSKLLDRMADMEHQVIEKKFIGLFYGSYGTGKTTAAQALAQKLKGEGRILYLDSADGWVSLDNIKPLKKSTTYLSVTDPRELMVIANALKTKAPNFEDITVVVLDEVSSWFTDTLHMYAREVTNTSDDADLPEIEGQMYAAPQAAFLNLIKTFHKAQDLHIIMIAHEQGRAIKGDKEQKMTPSLAPKLMNGLAQLAHVVARFDAKRDANANGGYRREAQVQPTRYVDAKTRIGGLDVKMDAIDLVNEIADWSNSTQMAKDLAAPEPQVVAEDPQDEETPEEPEEDFEVKDDETPE